MRGDDDEALLAAVQAGDARAMGRVVATHGPAVHALLRRMLRGDPAADDLFQDVFLAFARRAPELPRGTNLHAWLLVVAANRWRSNRRWRLVDPTRWLVLDAHGDREDTAAPFLHSTRNGEDELASREAVVNLERALATLEEPDRIVILLHLDEDLTNADRAAALGVGQPAYRKRLERARARLAACLSRDERPAP